MLPSYIRVNGKKIKTSFANQVTNCPRCYRFPVKVGDFEPCLGKLDPNQCSLMDLKGENYKYSFNIEWDKLLNEMKKVEEAEKPSMKWDSSFVSSEDSVEITNIPEDVMPEEVKEWLKCRGIML